MTVSLAAAQVALSCPDPQHLTHLPHGAPAALPAPSSLCGCTPQHCVCCPSAAAVVPLGKQHLFYRQQAEGVAAWSRGSGDWFYVRHRAGRGSLAAGGRCACDAERLRRCGGHRKDAHRACARVWPSGGVLACGHDTARADSPDGGRHRAAARRTGHPHQQVSAGGGGAGTRHAVVSCSGARAGLESSPVRLLLLPFEPTAAVLSCSASALAFST